MEVDLALLQRARQRIRDGRMDGGGDLAQALAGALRHTFERGDVPAGTKLPNEFDLAAQLQVSRSTLREAVRVLISEGWIESRRGIGSFVAPRTSPPLRGQLDTMSSMSAAIAATGARPGVRDLQIAEARATVEIARMLEIAPNAPLACISRTRLADADPVAAAVEYIILSGELTLARVKRFDGHSLYQFCHHKLELAMAYSRLSLSAVLASREVAERLALRSRAPVLLMREVVFDATGRPLLYTLNHHNSAIADFTLLRHGRPT
jgi:GntR family transcriptional regulator